VSHGGALGGSDRRGGAEHGGALGVGESFAFGELRWIEFGFEIELFSVDPWRAAGEKLGVDDAVGFANELEQRDMVGGVAVGCGQRADAAISGLPVGLMVATLER